jgi:signal transduction histidine kinase
VYKSPTIWLECQEKCTIFKHFNSLYLRLLLPVGGALLVAMVAAWAIALSLLTNVVDDQLEARLANATEALADGGFPFTPDLIRRLDRLIEARIALLDANGQVGLSTGDDAIRAALESANLQATASDAVAIVTIDIDGLALRAAIQALPLGRDDRYRYVVAAASLAESRAVTRDAALLLTAAMLVAALLMALFSSFFIRGITRPIDDLATMANRIAEGERGVAVSTQQDNEIGLLVQSFNDMAAKLDQYEGELARQSRLSGLGDLASRLAHEIRNPLTAMKMQLELLEDKVAEANRSRVTKVLDEIRRLELVVDNSLAMAGGSALNPVPTNVQELVGAVTDLLRPTLAHRHVSLASEIPELPPVALDADRMKQVLLNLVNNAADELRDGGEIRVNAGLRDDGGLDIHVDDSGPGMREQADVSNKPLGLGLGLRISREILEAHGGELLVAESPTLGGARFTLRLPASIMPAARP